ncbi:MAG TPA: MarR family transcriptional regulator [Ktedonobacterales bacterium]|nr:MarR family transcriptional regulator [Ktedonobacterales bacterium]
MATTSDDMPGGPAEVELSPAMREAIEAQRAIYRAVLGLNSDEWLSLDLSMGQLKALVTLTARRGMTVGEVAEALGVGKPAASMLVDRLTQHGYVTRHEDPNDRRRTVVTPTQAGEDLVTRLRQSGGERALVRWLRQMAPDDLAALTRGARALAAIIARDMEMGSATSAFSRGTPGRTE